MRVLLLVTFVAVYPALYSNVGAAPPMACDFGPIKKTFGGTEWAVFSCSDSRTVVIYSVSGSPAAEFYFMFFPDGDAMSLYGEGNGDKRYTDAAHKELQRLTELEIATLVKESRAAGRHESTK